MNVPMPIDVDTIARQMTAGAPAGSMRALVLVRLPSRRRHRTLWLAVPAAAGVLLLIVLVAVARRPAPPVGELPVAVATAPASARPAPSLTSVPEAQPVGVTAASRASLGRAPVHALPPARLPGLQPVPPPDVLRLDAVQPEGVDIPQLHIEPIATEPLRIPPLSGAGSREH